MIVRQPVEASPAETLTPRGRIALVVLLTGTFVAQVDFFIVNIALPSIQRELGATLSQVQLVAVTYGAAYAIAVVTGGRLGDLYGRRRLFIGGLVAFAVASLACGLAWNGWVLVAARVAQGIAAAVIMPQALGSLHAMFRGAARERAFAIFGISMGLAWVSGIVLGGLLVAADVAGWGWRVIFLINVPLVAIALVGALITLEESRRPAAATLDPGGILAFGAVVALLIIPLIQGRQAGWPPWTYACLALAAGACLALAAVERRVVRGGGDPVLSPELFRDGRFRLGLTVIVVFFLGPPGFFLLTTLYLQGVRQFSPLQASMCLLPFGVTFILGSQWSNRLRRQFGERVIVLGAGIMGVGLVGLALTVAGGADTSPVRLVAPVALIGLGQALVTTPLYEMLLRDIRREIASTATAVFTTVQLVAQSLSVAIVLIIFTAVLQSQLAPARTAQEAGLRDALAAAGVGADERGAAVAAYRRCVDTAAAGLAAGAGSGCGGGGGPAWQGRVDAAVRDAVGDAARRAYVGTLGFNLLVLAASGAIVARSVRSAGRRRADAIPA